MELSFWALGVFSSVKGVDWTRRSWKFLLNLISQQQVGDLEEGSPNPAHYPRFPGPSAEHPCTRVSTDGAGVSSGPPGGRRTHRDDGHHRLALSLSPSPPPSILGPLAGTNIQELVVFLETARCLSPSECAIVFYVAWNKGVSSWQHPSASDSLSLLH